MSSSRNWPATFVLAALVLCTPVAAHADEREHDHEVARELYEHGQIRSLEAIMAQLKKDVPGDIVSIELIQTKGQWVYRFQVVAADGHRSVVDIDAGPAAAASGDGGDD
ncbi:MAG: PepSY domain-containing protein [Devosia sp.]